MDDSPPRLIAQLRDLLTALDGAGIRHAIIGGIAVNIHGHVRATRDVDLLIAIEQEGELHELMTELGYLTLDRRAELSSYVRGNERADFLHANREISRNLLMEAESVTFAGVAIPVVSIEGLLGFKIQALNDDPSRLRDLSDMLELLRAADGQVDLDRVRGYFRLFDKEALLDDLLRAVAERSD
jgi:predicted nucleotidyltransferase